MSLLSQFFLFPSNFLSGCGSTICSLRLRPRAYFRFCILTSYFYIFIYHPSILPEKLSKLVTHGTLDKIFKNYVFPKKPLF